MPWHKFRADKDQIREVLLFIFKETDCRVYETYSEYDQDLREFRSVAECEPFFNLGVDVAGNGVARQFSLWSAAIMPPPSIWRISLKYKNYSFRYAIEGCGLFWFHFGGKHEGIITESSLGYFTEADARLKCTISPGHDNVNWALHKQLARKLKYLMQRYN